MGLRCGLSPGRLTASRSPRSVLGEWSNSGMRRQESRTGGFTSSAVQPGPAHQQEESQVHKHVFRPAASTADGSSFLGSAVYIRTLAHDGSALLAFQKVRIPERRSVMKRLVLLRDGGL